MFAALRIARRLQAGLLLLFVLSIGAAVASPLLGSHAELTLLCSGQGVMKLVDRAADGGDAAAGSAHKLECPLCLPLGTPASPEPAVAALEAPADAPCIGTLETLRIAPRVLRPPARAPPVDNRLIHEEAQP